MPELTTTLPTHRTDLLIRPFGERGQYVVKDPDTGEFFHLGERERFLLRQFDGQQTAEAICAAYEQRFCEALSQADLNDFVELARVQRLVEDEESTDLPAQHSDLELSARPPVRTSPAPTQSILYWRKTVFDPDRFFTWFEPKVRFFWTRGFVVFSAACILVAAWLVWATRHELSSSFAHAVRWETVVLVWLTLAAVTTLHEFAHGLTCKHHGGEVHEVGFLFMYLMPCFYCNVSDAWLFREKSKRLWVTFAGGYMELFLWSLAVFVWRLTLQDGLLNHLAFLVLSLCGVGTLFNFNPLLKLDGYYLLSDWLEMPNLQQRAWDYWNGHLRWFLWGAARPASEPQGRLLLVYGFTAGLYSVGFLAIVLLTVYQFLGTRWGPVGFLGALLLGVLTARSLLRGVSAGEVRKMIRQRHKRTAAWLLALGSATALLRFVQIEDRARGPFQVHAAARVELRAPVTGFLQIVYYDEGDQVSAGALVARLDVPDLDSRTAQKRAEVLENQATLRLLEAGARPEELAEQRHRVERAKAWRDLAEQDLAHERQAFEEELTRLDKAIAERNAELIYAQQVLTRAEGLASRGALAGEQYRDAEKKYQVSRAQGERAEAEKRARLAHGTLAAEAELARRQKELADAHGVLALLQAGTRPEQIDAERARLARLEEEVRYLSSLQEKLLLSSPLPGIVTTPRLRERVGQYFREGELICEVKEPARFEAVIALREQDIARVKPDQIVRLKVRALPFETLAARVDRVAPSAIPGEVQATVSVYCRMADAPSELRPGMSGWARIDCGQRPIGAVWLDRAARYVRTEFWSWW
jgi:multidrug efflux pump subunit AcrA (membrane-fusion protein)